jgi:hypothetical protein
MNSFCFLVTGKLTPEYVAYAQYSYQSIPHKVLSTWQSTDSILLHSMQSFGFTIVVNEEPVIKNSANFQSVCIVNGLHKIKEMGYKHCIRCRTDFIFERLPLLLDIVAPRIQTKLLCLSGMSSEVPKYWYYLDVIIAGNCDTMIQFFQPLMIEDKEFAEKFWLESYLGRPLKTKDDVKEVFDFFGLALLNQPISAHWVEKGWEVFHCYARSSNSFIWYE